MVFGFILCDLELNCPLALDADFGNVYVHSSVSNVQASLSCFVDHSLLQHGSWQRARSEIFLSPGFLTNHIPARQTSNRYVSTETETGLVRRGAQDALEGGMCGGGLRGDDRVRRRGLRLSVLG